MRFLCPRCRRRVCLLYYLDGRLKKRWTSGVTRNERPKRLAAEPRTWWQRVVAGERLPSGLTAPDESRRSSPEDAAVTRLSPAGYFRRAPEAVSAVASARATAAVPEACA
jgi:hypothetical protein